MTEKSRFWTDAGVGDMPAGGYSADEFAAVIRRLTLSDPTAEGVLRGVDNELAVSGSASPLAVASGAAIVYGIEYDNSASLNLTVSTPASGTTGGRVNLTADWSAQTIRAAVQMNTDGNPAIPALTQTPGSEWSIPLATFTITTAGAITLTDAREFCHFSTQLTADMIEAVTAYSVIGRASSGEGAAAAIAAGDNQVLALVSGVLAFTSVVAALLGSGAVTADKIAADSVDDTKLGDRAPQFYRRQGGNSSDWSANGSTTYTPTAVRMQSGVTSVVIADGDTYEDAAVTFPTAFSNKPIVIASVQAISGVGMATVAANSPATTGFTARAVKTVAAGAMTVTVNWLAIGPE